MPIIRKLIRNGNSWALSMNSVILDCLGIDPKNSQDNMVQYTIINDKLIISKSFNKNLSSNDSNH